MAPAAAQTALDPLPPPQAEGAELPFFEAETAAAGATAAGSPGPTHPPGRLQDPAAGASPAMADCARDLLRTRLAAAVSGEDLLAALAVETELLILCRERQSLVAAILEGELRLAALQTEAAPEALEEPVPEPPSDLLDQLGTLSAAPATATPSFTAEPAAEPAPAPAAAPDIGWFSIMGSAGDLRAGLTDGLEAWWVRTGSLVRGMTVSRIGTHPPGVEVEIGGQTHALPHRARWQDGGG